MQSAAGLRAVLTLVTIVMMMMVPAVDSAPASLDPELKRGGDRKPPDPFWSSPETREKTEFAKSRSNRRENILLADSSPDRREKFLKILMALEELHRSINSTTSSRITMMPRGNVRGSGKKNKQVAPEEPQRVTTVPPVDDGGTVSGPSDHPPESQSLDGKAFKKSLPQSPKKPNKRVCFWKYCSQN